MITRCAPHICGRHTRIPPSYETPHPCTATAHSNASSTHQWVDKYFHNTQEWKFIAYSLTAPYLREANGDNAGLPTQVKQKMVKRTVLAQHYGPPGMVVANLYRWLRGHSTNIEKMSTAKGLQCTCVGHLLERGGASWKERLNYVGRCVSSKLRLFVEHHFNARYFAEMFKDARTYLPMGEALVVMDFAMNYRCAPHTLLASCASASCFFFALLASC